MISKIANRDREAGRISIRAALALGILVLAAVLGITYVTVLPGFSSARNEPPALEISIASWLLRHSVPAAARAAVNPLGADQADITAGKNLYQEKCESCHAFDGRGKTEFGAATFPRVPDLIATSSAQTDGEIFYHIRNGIRNTAMPAWNLPERQIWQLVSFIRNLPPSAPGADPEQTDAATSATLASDYVGSEACASCHEETYARWKQTRMANVVRDPKLHPDAVLPDFSKPDPLLTFSLDSVALVYGSGWKQRYFRKVGDDYFPYPAQWDVKNETWRRYHVAENTDWWVPFYPDPGDNSQRPTGPLCDGCHSVDYNIQTKTPAEWNVGCESCHGAGSAHIDSPLQHNILNPARMNYVQANDTCIQCHSQGQPLENPIAGTYYDWPVGFRVGLELANFWKLEEHHPGEESFTHFADGSAHKNRMQGNDYVQSLMYARGVTCASCHDAHGTENPAMLKAPVKEICLTCHGPNTQSGPHTETLQAHTHHEIDSPGNDCVACHMPKIAQTISNVNVSSHTFRFITPEQSASLGVPNACTQCHQDETPEWATAALKTWKELSPWRMTR